MNTITVTGRIVREAEITAKGDVTLAYSRREHWPRSCGTHVIPGRRRAVDSRANGRILRLTSAVFRLLRGLAAAQLRKRAGSNIAIA